jgi:hypothetical protein
VFFSGHDCGAIDEPDGKVPEKEIPLFEFEPFVAVNSILWGVNPVKKNNHLLIYWR